MWVLFAPIKLGLHYIPSWLMAKSENEFPRKKEVQQVQIEGNGFTLLTNDFTHYSKTVISAPPTWSKPYIPPISGKANLTGRQLHSAKYLRPTALTGKKVLVAVEGNSGAQIVSEVSKVAQTAWSTRNFFNFYLMI